MERKIGEVFEYNGEWYQCIVGNGCENCAFNKMMCYTIADECCAYRRKDNKNVIFKKLEKVGEPYLDNCPSGRTICFQRYECYQKPIYTGDFICWADDINISIEIKQNKEEWKMEEKKLKLREFDLEAAKAGKPVCTRDGHRARIICSDAKYENSYKPIIALIDNGKNEFVVRYTKNGECSTNDDLDLMMLPEKKEGWVNVYSNCLGGPYESKEYALKQKMKGCIDTVKISWEE